MNLAIVTRADENIKDITDITHPLIKKYAEFCNADFIILDHKVDIHPHYRILKCRDLLDKYEQILVLDSDILITQQCTNIFDEVPKSHIGSIFEDVGSRQDHRRNLIKSVQEQRGDIGWKSGYINTGVFVISKEHKDIFDKIDVDNLWTDFGQDDIELGYQIHKLNIPIHELNYRWNFMSLFSEYPFNESRFNANFIHFAGNGHVTFLPKVEQIKRDYLLLKRYNMLFGE